MTGERDGHEAWRPSADEVLLIRAAVLPAEAAGRAWAEWRAHRHLDVHTMPEFQVLPALSHNVPRGAYDRTDLPRLKGVSRKTWAENQLLSAELSAALQVLANAGVAPLVARGLAVAAARPERLSQRSCDDTTLVLPPGQLPIAWQALQANGWTSRRGSDLQAVLEGRSPALVTRGARRPALRVSAKILPARLRVSDEGALWAGSTPTPFGESSATALDATGRLLLACVEGVTWRPAIDVRWVLDAAAELHEAGGALDGVVALARALRVSVALAVALSFLVDEVGLVLPAGLVGGLRASPAATGEARSYAAAARAPSALVRWRRGWRRLLPRPVTSDTQ